MPIFEYVPDVEPSETCEYCAGGFEEFQGMSDEHLEACPKCAQPCHRILSVFGISGKEKSLLSPKSLGDHGFTQYTKKGKGYYEKTAGKGPRTIVNNSSP